MAIIRQHNWLGQQRVDVPDLRLTESAILDDFDLLAGRIMSGKQPLVVRGFTIAATNTLGNPADELQLSVANGILMHFNASESGTLFVVGDSEPAEELSATNSKVSGSFSANTTNYIGLDLRRSADSTTSDTTKFLDYGTQTELTKTVPKGRTLSYKIIISTKPFSVSQNVCPVAKVVTDSNNNVLSITDARKLMFRLGSGGDLPGATDSFEWTDSDRSENPITYSASSSSDPFTGGDKEIVSLKQWMDAVMSVLWEAKGGQFWYSPSARDNIKLLYGEPVTASGDNFDWDLGSETIEWSGLKIAFENSLTAAGLPSYYNDIQAGSEVLGDGQCLYVDIQRDTAATLVPAVADLSSLGSPTTPGSRVILAWRIGDLVYTKDRAFNVGREYPVATTSVSGSVKLSKAATVSSDPVVLTDTERDAANGVAGLTASSMVLGTGLTRTGAAGPLQIGGQANDTSIVIGTLASLTGLINPTSIVLGAANAIRLELDGPASGEIEISATKNGGSGGLLLGTHDDTVEIGNFNQTNTIKGSTVEIQGLTGVNVTGDVDASGSQVDVETLVVNDSEPASTTAFQNTLSMKNIPKAWGTISTTGGGAVSVTSGFNIASASVTASHVEITLAGAIPYSGFAVIPVCNSSGKRAICSFKFTDGLTTVIRIQWLQWIHVDVDPEEVVIDPSASALTAEFVIF